MKALHYTPTNAASGLISLRCVPRASGLGSYDQTP